jgi:hypothetical protein
MSPHDIPRSDDLDGLEAMKRVILKKVCETFNYPSPGLIFAIEAKKIVMPVG